MISENLKSIIEELENQGKMYFYKGASEEQIHEFETKNSIKLPDKYREWLLYSDGGGFFQYDVQIYGVTHKPVIEINDDRSPDDKYIVIGKTLLGDPVLIEKGKETISIISLDDEETDSNVEYEDFFAFLRGLYVYLEIGE